MGQKITKDMLEEIAEKYCAEHTPFSKLAKEYGVSKTTLVRYFDGRGPVMLDEGTQARVDAVKNSNWIEGKSTSGNAGHTKLTDEEIVALANYMVENDLSLEQLVSEKTPVISRIYELFTIDRLGEELYSKVLAQYKKNRANTFSQYNESRRGNK